MIQSVEKKSISGKCIKKALVDFLNLKMNERSDVEWPNL